MKVELIKSTKIEKIDAEVLVAVVFAQKAGDEKFVKEIDELTDGTAGRFLEKNKKFGKLFESITFHVSPKKHPKIERVSLVGFGKEQDLDNLRIRQGAGFIGKNLLKDAQKAVLYLPDAVARRADLAVVGLLSGSFNPGHHKSANGNETTNGNGKTKLQNLAIVSEKNIDPKLVDKGSLMGESINKVREVVNQPANVATPQYMVNFAKKIAADNKLKIEIFSEKQVNEMGMGIMASVAKGSEEDLYFVILKYLGAGSKGPTLAIVGKGITFDSGGISIKPSESMEWMKMDMAGAAACFGAMEALSKLAPKVNVICACPLTENLPSGKASKPGDVVRGISGKTVEIINTDAEGRLVLADALSYVQKNYKPDYIVDVATLTGASIVALGNVASAILGKPQKFIDEIIQTATQTGERLWQLPLYDEYRDLLKSYIADIANVSAGRGAGTETGAKFLEEFVDSKQAWAHLDIAPSAWEESDKPYASKGGSAFVLSTLVELALRLEK